jgi:hypothetical protein
MPVASGLTFGADRMRPSVPIGIERTIKVKLFAAV